MSIKSKVIVKTRLNESKFKDLNAKFKRNLNETVFPKSIRLGYYIKKDKHSEDNTLVFYLTNKQKPFTDKNTLTKDSIGYIQTIVNKNEDNVHINWLSIQPKHRGNGHATRLIYITALYAKSLKITEITLEDSTGDANTTNNIYTKCGFKYTNEYDFAEMTGHTEVILSTVSSFKL